MDFLHLAKTLHTCLSNITHSNNDVNKLCLFM